MTRRRLGLAAIAACLFAGSSVLLWSYLAPIKPDITAANFRLLHEGMTDEEIEAILGQKQTSQSLTGGTTLAKRWEGEEGVIAMDFDCVGGGPYRGQFVGKDG